MSTSQTRDLRSDAFLHSKNIPTLLPLHTARLILRRFAAADLDRFLAYRSDADVERYQGWGAQTRDEALSFIEGNQSAAFGVPGEWFQIALAEQQSDALLGDIGMHVDGTEPTSVELGFTLARGAQGKGYAREAASTLIDALFATGAVTKIVCIADARNEPSLKLLRRLAMTHVRSDEVEFKGEQCTEHTFERVAGPIL